MLGSEMEVSVSGIINTTFLGIKIGWWLIIILILFYILYKTTKRSNKISKGEKMVTLRCQDCGKTYDGKKSDDAECDCGGSYAIKGSDDDSYEETFCANCKKDTQGDTQECAECSEEELCNNCVVYFENADITICKECIDKQYSVKEKVVEKEVIKYVEVPKEVIKVMGFSEPIL